MYFEIFDMVLTPSLYPDQSGTRPEKKISSKVGRHFGIRRIFKRNISLITQLFSSIYGIHSQELVNP